MYFLNFFDESGKIHQKYSVILLSFAPDSTKRYECINPHRKALKIQSGANESVVGK